MQRNSQLFGSVQFTWRLVLMLDNLKDWNLISQGMHFFLLSFMMNCIGNVVFFHKNLLNMPSIEEGFPSHRYFHLLCKSDCKIVHGIHSFISSFVHSVPFSNLICDWFLAQLLGRCTERKRTQNTVFDHLFIVHCWQGSNNLFLIMDKYPARSQCSTH